MHQSNSSKSILRSANVEVFNIVQLFIETALFSNQHSVRSFYQQCSKKIFDNYRALWGISLKEIEQRILQNNHFDSIPWRPLPLGALSQSLHLASRSYATDFIGETPLSVHCISLQRCIF